MLSARHALRATGYPASTRAATEAMSSSGFSSPKPGRNSCRIRPGRMSRIASRASRVSFRLHMNWKKLLGGSIGETESSVSSAGSAMSKPRSRTRPMMVSIGVVPSTRIISEVKLSSHSSMPSSFETPFSTVLAHPAQSMPVILNVWRVVIVICYPLTVIC